MSGPAFPYNTVVSDGERGPGVDGRIGHFKVVGELGRGGMGTVYVGLDETLGRRVALKVIRPDQRLDPLRKARFLREARVLAKLDHPNVCKLHDFIEGAGHDCLVLELVEGRSLREAMEGSLDHERKLDIAEQLFDVLVAVHGRGLIHRDLKPANIMLCDSGIKVLDFGLARPVQDPDALSGEFPAVSGGDPRSADGPDGAGMTTAGSVLGTVGYMSPEVARGEPATAASDLYAAGLILQELFTGRRAIPEELPAAERHRRAMWSELEPVEGLPADLAALIGRLESLVPENRPSAIDAAAMLRAIRERPRRQRRRFLVAAVWAILALFGVGMTIQFLRAESEARRAEAEASTAREVADFLIGLFEHASPRVSQGEEITVRDLLQRGAETIEAELEGQPAVRARMLHTLGIVHYHLGYYDDAAPLLEESLAIRRGLPVRDRREELVDSLSAVGMVRRAEGRYQESAALFDEALEAVADASGEVPAAHAHLLVSRSGLDQDLGEWAEAESRLLRAVAILEARPEGVDQGLTDALYDLATLYRKLRRLPEASRALERCSELDREVFGERSEQVAGDLAELAAVAAVGEHYDQAEVYARQSLELRREILGADHPHVGHSATTLGYVLTRLGRTSEAETAYRRALEIYRAGYGPEHPYVGDALHSLGAIASEQGRLAEAEAMLRDSLRITEASRGPEHPLAAETLHNLALVLVGQGRLDEAEALYRRALAIREGAYGADNPRVAETLEAYADCLRDVGRTGEADRMRVRAAAIRTAANDAG